MRRGLRLSLILSASLAAAGLIGCGSSVLPAPAQRLPGKWHGAMIVYEEELQGKIPPEKIAELAKMQMDFEFRSDGSMVLSAANPSGQADLTQARWELVNQAGDLLTIKSTEPSGAQKQINFEFDGADTFYMPIKTEVAELGAMRFTRLR